MSTSLAVGQPVVSHPEMASDGGEHSDPFLSTTTGPSHHRFSHFDSQLFALSPNTSPGQAKQALEAHLAETERRIQEASKLGTTLVQQRKDLADRLKDVERQQSEGDITPELRQKLVEIEKEYNEVGLESARAFLPKSRVSSSEMAGSPFPGDTKRSISPSKFESQATASPSKLSVPNRKQRNQPANRVHDIEFATEISTSLLSQVRHLQALLSEKEETLKAVSRENSRLELEAEGFHQRLRSLDESEHRYKDENWNLETQIHEFLASAKEAADREKKLTQNLNVLQAEKSSAQKELDEIKLSHSKLSDDHASALKHHDHELGSLKRSMTTAESERGALQRKVDDLIGQNSELARAVAHQRGRLEDHDQSKGLSDEDFETAPDNATPEHSPPPSPVKGTPRHSMLESETLKSSLHHAHRMIQNLKGNIHREKTEKLELKRMLQDARDELDARRSDLGSAHGKRNRKVESREFKKPLKPNQLGGLRSSRSEIYLEDPNWEEETGEKSPSQLTAGTTAQVAVGGTTSVVNDASDHFETANEASDAFETANERATETEDFQTGVEDMSGSDELTETEGGPTATLRNIPQPLALTKARNRNSFQSTASASGDEYSYEDVKTPPTLNQPRLRLRVSRGGTRRSRIGSEEPQLQSSPASFASSSRDGTPQPGGQSLFAELGELSDEEESFQSTPSRSTFISSEETPASRPNTAKNTPLTAFAPQLVPRVSMVDSGMMTEPWEPTQSTLDTILPYAASAGGAGVIGIAASGTLHTTDDRRVSTDSQIKNDTSDAASQWHVEQTNNMLGVNSHDNSRPISASTYSDMSSQYDPELIEEKLAKFPSPPTSRAHTPMASLSHLDAMAVPLSMSTIVSEHVEPESPSVPEIGKRSLLSTPRQGAIPGSLAFAIIQSVDTEPIEPLSPRSPRRDGVIIPRDESYGESAAQKYEQDETLISKHASLEPAYSWDKSVHAATPIIAEDETHQSSGDSPVVEISESQRPFRELSNNTNRQAAKKLYVETNDESSQTALTAEQIEDMFSGRKKSSILVEDSKLNVSSPPRINTNAAVLKVRKSQDSIGSVGRARSKMADPDFIHDSVPIKRPTSAGSGRHGSRSASVSSIHPPLPTDHKQVIAAAAQRTGSANGGPGSMGPPLLPASAYRANPSFRPRTPSSQPPMSPVSFKNGITPRPLHSSGNPAVYSPSGTGRSRASSVSSFTSEVETRFNLRAGMPMSQGLDAGTDPRMINAITQTMIGEYLWKYTRKAGRGAMSENRHRRYFWVHPYTRTLYWSDRDPSSAGRAELKAKSVPIEAVRVVTDDNPMPPGLHRKSLIIMTPGRAVKFTATTGQRHETWFNALSYLLLRTGEDAIGDSSQVANGALTQDDVAEFNPGYGNNTTRRGAASLSSYNSRTTRNDSPVKSTRLSMSQIPQGSTSSRPSLGKFSRLSSYWKPGGRESGQTGSFSSRRSRHSVSGNGSIYEASEVHDSAEDLREMIEKQDRESDRLENVRACCDGKHDVGHLHNSSAKGRHSHNHVTGAASGSQRPSEPRQHSRNSVIRRTE